MTKDLSLIAYEALKNKAPNLAVVLVVERDPEDESILFSSYTYNEEEDELSAIDAIKSSITAERLAKAYMARSKYNEDKVE